MKILITGGAGFIGSAVARRAVREGYEVVNVDALTYAGDLMNVASVEADRLYAFEEVDITHAAAMSAVFAKHRPDAVMHLAAETHVDRFADGPMAYVRSNVTGTGVMLETTRKYLEGQPAAKRRSFRFHHVSTDEAYGAQGADPRDDTRDGRPNSPYVASKAAADMLVRAWGSAYDMPVVISTTSHNYGPFQHPEKLIPTVILNGLAGLPIPIYGRGRQTCDWLYVEDHAAALLELLMRGRVGETYSVIGETERSNLELVGMICAALDRAAPRRAPYAEQIKFVDDRRHADQGGPASNAKIEEHLGWRPSVPLDAGIERTVRWYMENEDWVRGRAAHHSAEVFRLAAG